MRANALILLLLVLAVGACRQPGSAVAASEHPLPDTLRVATLYSPSSYFIYKDMTMGYDYGLISSLAKEKGIAVDLSIAASLADAMDMLESGDVDLIAYEVPITSEYKERVVACGPVNVTSQVLVQPTGRNDTIIKDVTGLVGRDIYVEAGSKYQQRIENLNSELGGGVRIHPVERDTLITEDLIEMVQRREIPLTVVDSDIARVNKTYYPDLDITLEVGFPQRSAWAVDKDRKWLADSIDAWITTDRSRKENDELLKRYFELSKTPGSMSEFKLDLKSGKVSAYDAIFKKYAAEIGIDWRLLAAIGYTESQFDNNAVSWAGARGIMQIMPSTARANGADPEMLVDPDTSVRVAAKILNTLNTSLAGKVPDQKERLKFLLASYNAGLGHIYDAIEIARDTGRTPDVWYGSVEEALALKSKPEYYNKPYCRNGYLRGNQTIQYVQKVMNLYDIICQNIN